MIHSSDLQIARNVNSLRTTVHEWRSAGFRIALVPTMGALHEGHLTLVREALRRADRVVVSNFVNPTQFAAHEDLGAYPRQQEQDARLLAETGAHLMFAPSPADMYPDGFATSVAVAGPALGLESEFRPRMFGGVALVVTKLLNQVQPDVAAFGEKDYQQLMVIRRFVRDLDIPVQIVGSPTERDGWGLALSSRNAYLSEAELGVARRLNGVLAEAGTRAGDGVEAAEAWASQTLLDVGFDSIDYVAIRRAEDLAAFTGGAIDAPARILAAVKLGTTRLIDNMAIQP
ncbi:MAG: pantoate--beta-alanine ligase [Brevundimonas sp.]|uniref:pantoate--beta-alanine ligase n=1 Tax=Brevundimonas sp. TaxID=1871086 RepID=UPI0011F74997|nr:pantoate--beta-alanine ligase [Brevundimonas sp.]RZJ17476.1 MAG: pantoate--beta-alanine ligase [Brevundimonas sp.]